MKKFLFGIAALTLFSLPSISQNGEDDSKFRFGLRVNAQPTWFASAEKSNTPSGAKFGYGFGLNIERRLTRTAAFLFGIGGDFEGGKYTYRNDKSANYEPMYLLDENNEFVKSNAENRLKSTNTGYILKERTVKTTFVSIPLVLKLSTKEIGGLKYSGLFGGELGIRVKATANDTYLGGRKFAKTAAGADTSFAVAVEDQSGLNIGKECSIIPLRVGFNAGIGVEYKLSGSTAAFVNVNYFLIFNSLLKKESEYTVYKTEPGADNSTPIKQNLKYRGIRISVGIMF